MSLGHYMRDVTLVQDGNPVLGLLIASFWSGHEDAGKWRGGFCITRTSDILERLVAKDPVFWITTTVRESDGSLTRYLYPEASIRFQDAGTWSPSRPVRQRVAFTCDTRTIV